MFRGLSPSSSKGTFEVFRMMSEEGLGHAVLDSLRPNFDSALIWYGQACDSTTDKSTMCS
jgi:hypothetical protein